MRGVAEADGALDAAGEQVAAVAEYGLAAWGQQRQRVVVDATGGA